MQTRDGRQLTIREAEPEDACALREFVLEVTGQTNFLSFGPDEYGKKLLLIKINTIWILWWDT